MPDTIIFDTHQFIKRLISAGMNNEQAEALAEAINEGAKDRIASKGDIKDLQHDIEIIKRDLKLWMFATQGALGLLIVALKLFG